MTSIDDDLFAPIVPKSDKDLILVRDIVPADIKDSNGVLARDLYYTKGTEFQVYGHDAIYVVVEEGDYSRAKAKLL